MPKFIQIDKSPVVYIEWVDSQITYGWTSKEDDDLPALIKSVGILVSEFKHCVTISTSKSSNEKFTDKLTIPKICIKKYKRL